MMDMIRGHGNDTRIRESFKKSAYNMGRAVNSGQANPFGLVHKWAGPTLFSGQAGLVQIKYGRLPPLWSLCAEYLRGRSDTGF